MATELINKLNQQDVWNRINGILIYCESEFQLILTIASIGCWSRILGQVTSDPHEQGRLHPQTNPGIYHLSPGSNTLPYTNKIEMD